MQRSCRLLRLIVVLLALACMQTHAIDNGLGRTPPMGWRSWNCFHADINQQIMQGIVDAMVARNRTVDGKPTSLLDLGYASCGLDDNWQDCGAGVDNTFHDAQGNPIINKDRFPDMAGMTNYGHTRGVRMGWYHNNCICSENSFPNMTAHYHGDVNAIASLKFDGVKLDGCGAFRNLSYWAELLNATGRPVMIENCHWGGDVPTLDWCPFNFFRTSGDISNNWDSFFKNLQTTIKFQDYKQPLARPGCWAYPDMLEVGNLKTFEEDRAHFGAWCIVSSPLILGFDLRDQDTMERVWDIISNKEAIAVNQNWAGHPGMLVQSFAPQPPNETANYVWAVAFNASDTTQTGWKYDSSRKAIISPAGECLDAGNTDELQTAACTGSSDQTFEYDASSGNIKHTSSGDCVDVYNFNGPVVQLFGCNGGCNQKFMFPSNKTLTDTCGKCFALRDAPPSGEGAMIQVWAKPQPNSGVAVLVLNGDTVHSHQLTITVKSLNMTTADANVRDIWQRKDVGSTTGGVWKTDAVGAHDSRFYLFTPRS